MSVMTKSVVSLFDDDRRRAERGDERDPMTTGDARSAATSGT
jgi:hypothetical protein